MDIEHDDPDLDRLETDRTFAGGYAPSVVKGFRKAMMWIRAAIDERDLLALRGLNFKRLENDRAGQWSMKLNDQWRLIVEVRGEAPKKRIGVVEIVDYH